RELVGVLDAKRGSLRLTREVPGHDRNRAELADAAGRGEDDAVDDRPPDRRQRHAGERLPARGSERLRGLFLLRADLAQGRNDLAHHEWPRDEDRGEDDRRRREENLVAVALEPAEPALRAVERDEREAHDDGR